MMADLYISGFAATAICVWLRHGQAQASQPGASAAVALIATFVTALVWPPWLVGLSAEVMEAR